MFILEKLLHLQLPQSDDAGIRMTQNNGVMRRIKRYMNISGILYASTCLLYAVGSLYMSLIGLISGVGDPLVALIDGPVAKGAILVLGFLGCTDHKPNLSWIAVLIQTVCACLSGFTYFDAFLDIIGINLNALFLVLYIALAVVNTVCSKQYRALELEEGFPTFNIILEEQRQLRRKFEESDPFAEQMARYQKNSSSDMMTLDMGYRSADNGAEKSDNAGAMDEI